MKRAFGNQTLDSVGSEGTISFIVKRWKRKTRKSLYKGESNQFKSCISFLNWATQYSWDKSSSSPLTLSHISCFLVLTVNSIKINSFRVCVKLVRSEMDSRPLGPCFFPMELLRDYELLCHERRRERPIYYHVSAYILLLFASLNAHQSLQVL